MSKPLDHWPRLSESLPFVPRPDVCQACRKEGSVDPIHHASTPELIRWTEHDLFDRPERIIVVLCQDCSKRLIDKHPRLYSIHPPFAPVAGAMPMCLDCRHRNGTACASPKARANGGEGIGIYGPQPAHVHVNRGGRGRSGYEQWYQGPMTRCDGKETEADPCL